MSAVRQRAFGTFKFRDRLPSSAGDIPVSSLGSMMLEGQNVLCALEAGRRYTPGMHPYGCMVIIVEGTGKFRLSNTDLMYMPGTVFRISADIEHGFVLVETNTVFIKQVRTTRPYTKR